MFIYDFLGFFFFFILFIDVEVNDSDNGYVCNDWICGGNGVNGMFI